jgi:TPR repeat protein
MSKKGLIFLLLYPIAGLTFCQTSQDYVTMADKAFDAGKKEDAKKLYLKAAAMNNGDAHFAIAYKFVVTDDESVFHFSEAARLGNAEALGYALDELFFRAGSLTKASPEKAYALYQ